MSEDEELNWAVYAHYFATGYMHKLACSLERGDEDLGIDPAAWTNTMAAVDWAVEERIQGRMQGPTTVTPEDVARIRRVSALGLDAIHGGERSEELIPLISICIDVLLGPGRIGAVVDAARAVLAVKQRQSLTMQ